MLLEFEPRDMETVVNTTKEQEHIRFCIWTADHIQREKIGMFNVIL